MVLLSFYNKDTVFIKQIEYTDSVHCTLGVAKIFRFTCTLFGASLHIVEHLPEVSAKNNDRYPTQNAVLCLPLNNFMTILCRDT